MQYPDNNNWASPGGVPLALMNGTTDHTTPQSTVSGVAMKNHWQLAIYRGRPEITVRDEHGRPVGRSTTTSQSQEWSTSARRSTHSSRGANDAHTQFTQPFSMAAAGRYTAATSAAGSEDNYNAFLNRTVSDAGSGTSTMRLLDQTLYAVTQASEFPLEGSDLEASYAEGADAVGLLPMNTTVRRTTGAFAGVSATSVVEGHGGQEPLASEVGPLMSSLLAAAGADVPTGTKEGHDDQQQPTLLTGGTVPDEAHHTWGARPVTKIKITEKVRSGDIFQQRLSRTLSPRRGESLHDYERGSKTVTDRDRRLDKLAKPKKKNDDIVYTQSGQGAVYGEDGKLQMLTDGSFGCVAFDTSAQEQEERTDCSSMLCTDVTMKMYGLRREYARHLSEKGSSSAVVEGAVVGPGELVHHEEHQRFTSTSSSGGVSRKNTTGSWNSSSDIGETSKDGNGDLDNAWIHHKPHAVVRAAREPKEPPKLNSEGTEETRRERRRERLLLKDRGAEHDPLVLDRLERLEKSGKTLSCSPDKKGAGSLPIKTLSQAKIIQFMRDNPGCRPPVAKERVRKALGVGRKKPNPKFWDRADAITAGERERENITNVRRGRDSTTVFVEGGEEGQAAVARAVAGGRLRKRSSSPDGQERCYSPTGNLLGGVQSKVRRALMSPKDVINSRLAGLHQQVRDGLKKGYIKRKQRQADIERAERAEQAQLRLEADEMGGSSEEDGEDHGGGSSGGSTREANVDGLEDGDLLGSGERGENYGNRKTTRRRRSNGGERAAAEAPFAGPRLSEGSSGEENGTFLTAAAFSSDSLEDDDLKNDGVPNFMEILKKSADGEVLLPSPVGEDCGAAGEVPLNAAPLDHLHAPNRPQSQEDISREDERVVASVSFSEESSRAPGLVVPQQDPRALSRKSADSKVRSPRRSPRGKSPTHRDFLAEESVDTHTQFYPGAGTRSPRRASSPAQKRVGGGGRRSSPSPPRHNRATKLYRESHKPLLSPVGERPSGATRRSPRGGGPGEQSREQSRSLIMRGATKTRSGAALRRLVEDPGD